MPPVFQLIYNSRAASKTTLTDVDAILRTSRARNLTADVTGILLYVGYSFVQVLEGTEAAVEDIFSSIEKDIRHTSVTVLLRGDNPERVFKDWSMGFEHCPSSAEADLSGAFRVGHSTIEERISGSDNMWMKQFLFAYYDNSIRANSA